MENSGVLISFPGVANAVSQQNVILLEDEFFALDTLLWKSTNDGATGTNVVIDGVGGLVGIVTANADNDYNLMASANKCFKFAANQPLYLYAKMRLTEGNTNTANWVIGLSDTLTAGFMINNGGGPAASYDGAVFFKVDGTMHIQCESSKAAVQVTEATAAAFKSATEYILEIFFDGVDNIKFFVNTVCVASQTIAVSGLKEMCVIYGVKAGSNTAETLVMDSILCIQQR